MKPKDIIGLVFRIVGLGGILYVVNHLFRVSHRYDPPLYDGTPHFNEPLKLIAELGLILIGIYMVCGAPLFMKFIYPDDPDKDKPDEKPKDKL